MPTRKVRGGYRYGTRGKVYPTRAQADRQGRAIKAAQYRKSKRKWVGSLHICNIQRNLQCNGHCGRDVLCCIALYLPRYMQYNATPRVVQREDMITPMVRSRVHGGVNKPIDRRDLHVVRWSRHGLEAMMGRRGYASPYPGCGEFSMCSVFGEWVEDTDCDGCEYDTRRNHGSEEDRKVREGEDPGVDRAQAGEDAVCGQERKGGGAMERGLVADTPGARGDGGVGAGPDRVERPQWWVFTFGVGHEHAGHYVRINGTFSEARAEMVRRFGRWWAFQYSQDEWERTVRNMKSMGWPVETELKEDADD